MAKFANRLKQLRTEFGLTQPQLAKKMGMSSGAIGNYESGKRMPSIDDIEAFANFFNVDMNSILGYSNEPHEYTLEHSATKIDIKKQRESLGLYLEDVANYVGVSIATVSRWERGEIASIKQTYIIKLAEVLHVQPLDILGSEQAETSKKVNIPADLMPLVSVWEKVSDEDKAIVKIIADKYK